MVMKKFQLELAVTLAMSVMTGCRSSSVAHRADPPSRTEASSMARSETTSKNAHATVEPVESAESRPDEIQQTSAESVSESSQSHAPAGPIRYSIQSAIETGLNQNPDLVALRQNDPVGTAVLGVAQTYPFNPFIQVQATPFQHAPNNDTINAGSGTTYHYVLLMQQIQLGHQQQFREDVATASLNGIRWNIIQAELLNVAQTERLYFAAIYQKGIWDLAKLNAKNNEDLLSILQIQQENGQATAADVAIVRLDVKSTRQQLRIAEANYQTALLDLKRHLCLPPDLEIQLVQSPFDWSWQPAEVTELTSMAMNRPDVMAARADADSARANTCLADANRIPDVQIGPYYQRTDSGISYLGFRAQMDLPVINNGTPMLRQRQAEFCQRVAAAQQIATRANLEAVAVGERYERARSLIENSAENTRVSVPIELQRLEEQFKANEVDILRVIQARNSLLQSQRADLDALNEVMQAAVAITASTGIPLESLATTTVPEKTP